MIHRQVSAVFQLRDGFTGRMLPNAGGLLARLDGAPCRPLWKQGGYWVLTDLAPGPHRLELVLAGYRPEPVEWSWDGAAPWQGCVVLKPGQGYPFRGDVTRLVLQLSGKNGPLAHEAVWLCTLSAAQPKLAQDEAQPGDTQLRLYYKGPAAALPVPGAFLLQDGGHTERIELLRLEGEQGILAAPLEQKHSRGRELLPAQPYTADRQGVVEALLCQPCQLTVQCRGQVKTFDLAPGENQGQWQLEGR